MHFTLSIQTAQTRFSDDHAVSNEVARILRAVADEVAEQPSCRLHGVLLRDAAGRRVGITSYKFVGAR